jgi:hypothetical protein
MMNDDLPIVAFPQTVGNEHCFGMMLRDYFAAKALQGMLADSDLKATPKEFAQLAYAMANAMLEARK